MIWGIQYFITKLKTKIDVISQGAALSVYQDVHLQLHRFYIFGYFGYLYNPSIIYFAVGICVSNAYLKG